MKNTDPTNDSTRPDGRRLRSEASRTRIVEALLALVAEGGGLPSAEVVATRAGVGLRTVFRLFEDMDGLYRSMQVVLTERFSPLLELPGDLGEDWRDRLTAMIERRAGFYEAIMLLQVAADSQRHRSPALQEGRTRLVRILREGLILVLPPTLREDAVLVDALELSLSFEAWRRLRMDQHASIEHAHAVLNRPWRCCWPPARVARPRNWRKRPGPARRGMRRTRSSCPAEPSPSAHAPSTAMKDRRGA